MSRQPPRSERGAALVKILADGEWHDVEEVVAAVAPVIAPGAAFRTAELQRAANRRHSGREMGERVHHTATQSVIARGARYKIVDAIAQRRRCGSIEQRTRDGVVEIRKAP